MTEKRPHIHTIVANKKAGFHYEIVKTFEAGIALLGHEVKSLRAKKVQFAGSFVTITSGRVTLVGLHIAPYEHVGNKTGINPERPRELFIHGTDQNYLLAKMREKGFAVIPTEIYFKGNLIKVSIALGRGKKVYEKKEAIKKRDVERDLARTLKEL